VGVTRADVVATIEAFLEGTGQEWDWDDFISLELEDPSLEDVRRRCVSLPLRFPPTLAGYYCSEEGLEELREMSRVLRSHVPPG
jgi:hypothetical protein